jgi:hypothetical protein
MKNKKALVLSLVMAALMAMPMMTFAQNGSLFGYENGGGSRNADISGGSRDANISITGSSMSLGNATETDPTVPLGSGLLIMVAAGAGYAIYKKKED